MNNHYICIFFLFFLSILSAKNLKNAFIGLLKRTEKDQEMRDMRRQFLSDYLSLSDEFFCIKISSGLNLEDNKGLAD